MASNIAVVVVAVALWAIIVFAMYRGWRRRSTMQSGWVGELPAPPRDPGSAVLGPVTGLYVGSAIDGNWQARVTAEGLGRRGAGTITAYRTGVLIERDNDAPVWLPRAEITGVRLDRRLAGKVMTRDGLLVITWHPPGSNEPDLLIDTGFRADDKTIYPEWTAELTAGPGGKAKK